MKFYVYKLFNLVLYMLGGSSSLTVHTSFPTIMLIYSCIFFICITYKEYSLCYEGDKRMKHF